jgi:cytochrome c-type biogenesis protein
MLAGGRLHLPMPGRRASGRTGPLSVYSLGIFSGVTSSCCAPVLAGVIALSGVAGSFGAAAGLGSAYVFGMVAPLFVISLLWERFDLRSSRLFRPRSLTWRLGPVRRTVSATALASGILLALMGGATMYIGLFKDSMPSPRGWQASLSATLQHYGTKITHALSFVPGWVAAVLLVMVIATLARHALRQLVAAPPQRRQDEPEPEARPTSGAAAAEPEQQYVS